MGGGGRMCECVARAGDWKRLLIVFQTEDAER